MKGSIPAEEQEVREAREKSSGRRGGSSLAEMGWGPLLPALRSLLLVVVLGQVGQGLELSHEGLALRKRKKELPVVCMCVCVCVCVCMLSRVRLIVTPWIVAHQDPQSMGLSRQEYWSGLPFPPPGDLPHPGFETESLLSPSLADRFFTPEPFGKTQLPIGIFHTVPHVWKVCTLYILYQGHSL